MGPACGKDRHLLQDEPGAGPHRGVPQPRRALRVRAASRADRGRHGVERHRRLDRRDGGAAAGRHRRHDPRVAHPGARRQPHARGAGGAGDAPDDGPARVHAHGERLPGMRPHHEHGFPGPGDEDRGLSPRPDAGLEVAVSRGRRDARRSDGLRGERPGRVEACRHRHQPAWHRGGAGGARVRRRQEDRDAQGRAHRRGVPGDRRRLRQAPLRRRRRAHTKADPDQSGLMEKVRPALLRGFDQEYLPHEQLQFNHLLDIIRRNFELYGFLPIETPSAERTEVLTSKGGVEKEIYALKRLAATAEEDEAAAKGALRFDLTVPLARYVAMRERELAFPFRRYQIQRVWRGETPQAKKGRFREFYQCDIDIINREKLSYLAEAEIPSVVYSVFKEMAIGEFRIRVNNRKVLAGLLRHFSVPDEKAPAVRRILDKVDKESPASVKAQLEREGVRKAGLLELNKGDTGATLKWLSGLPQCAEGLAELRSIVDAIRQFGVPDSAFAVDLGVVRGL